jgi:uncharacterized membrane protein YbhN (UPF0104 family)
VRQVGRIGVGLASVALAIGLLVAVLPRIAGVGWDDTSDRIGGLPVIDLCALIVVWAAGLATHTLVLRAALPGLTSRRAWALNLSGSSVSNVLPLGGAAGVGLNYAMLRSWGYERTEITAWTLMTNMVVATVKVMIAAVGVVVLLHTPALARGLGGNLLHHIAQAAAALAGLGLLTLIAARGPILRRTASSRSALTRHCQTTLLANWRSVVLGGIAYPLLQMLMFGICLHVIHAGATPVAVVAAYAVERLCTLVPLTPGGVGIVETTATATLVAFGVDAPVAAAGVVLFRVFSYLIEIPLGGVIAAGWVAQTRRRLRLQQA